MGARGAAVSNKEGELPRIEGARRQGRRPVMAALLAHWTGARVKGNEGGTHGDGPRLEGGARATHFVWRVLRGAAGGEWGGADSIPPHLVVLAIFLIE
jgi:hypothetical protein